MASEKRIEEIIEAGQRAIWSKSQKPWNKIKPDPRDSTLRQLLACLKEEVDELEEAINELPLDDLEIDKEESVKESIAKHITWSDILKDKKYRPKIDHIISEVGDVGFYASMMADWVQRTDMEKINYDHTKRYRGEV